DGEYVVKLQDLTLGGGAEYFYRLDIDSGPRVAFVSPCVVQRGQPARLTVHGWNLGAAATPKQSASDGLQTLELNLSASDTSPRASLPVRLRGYQAVVDWTMVETPGGALPALVSVTDAPVVVEARAANRRKDDSIQTHDSAQPLTAPVEVAADFDRPDEVDWYSIDAAAGEVFYFEAFGQRIGSPIDLQIDVHEFRTAAGETRTASDATVGSPAPPESTAPRAPNTTRIQRLASFEDETDNHGGRTVPTDHLDPCGRWVAPRAGRFLISVRNLKLGASAGPRRQYRLAVRREEPEFRVLAMPRSEEVRGLNVARGGRETIELVALRRRGMDGPICVRAGDLPFGLT
ncbi:MAG TPA: hypothetical protein PLV92_29805, partial [Pirellulaceae bacterium]|nr:hypothetical protein [Pirellulaceae bacterium]